MSKLLIDIRQELIQNQVESRTTENELIDITGGQRD